jgi:anion-transporting  ArsA/GET3 family ATPase
MNQLDLEGLLSKRMVLVSGKGGVGKTTVATALSLVAARQGRRVLLAQFESNVDAGQLLNSGRVGNELGQLSTHLWGVNMTPLSALREYGMLVFRLRAIQRAVMENRMVRHFLRAIPGLDDYAMLGKAWYHTTEQEGDDPRFDLVVVDGPATGQMLKVLRVPPSILEVVPDSMLSRDARTIWELLTDPARCAALIVTLAEELPVTEAVEFEHALRESLGLPVAALVVNQLYPRRTCPELMELEPTDLGGDPTLTALLGEARILAQRRAINDHHLGVLGEQSRAPLLRLPRLFSDTLGPAELTRLADHLAAGGIA